MKPRTSSSQSISIWLRTSTISSLPPNILIFQHKIIWDLYRKGMSFPKIKQHQQICPRPLNYLHHTFSTEEDLQLRSESEALSWALSHDSGGGRRIGRSGPAARGARPVAGATACRRDGEAAEQQVHGGQQGLEEAHRAEGWAAVWGEVYFVGVWAGGDEGWLELVWSAAEWEERGCKKLMTELIPVKCEW